MGRTAPDVARELIEQDQQCQRALRRLLPFCQLTPRGGVVSGLEPADDLGIEAIVLGKPLVRPGGLPEADDFGRAGQTGIFSRTRQAVMAHVRLAPAYARFFGARHGLSSASQSSS